MINVELEKLIKEHLKDIALRMSDLNDNDTKSLLAEYREFIIKDFDANEILMLPYEAYTDRVKTEFIEDGF